MRLVRIGHGLRCCGCVSLDTVADCEGTRRDTDGRRVDAWRQDARMNPDYTYLQRPDYINRRDRLHRRFRPSRQALFHHLTPDSLSAGAQ
jgi:hypothetical protein